MHRFLDNWVVERTLFEFVNQGSCACCTFSQALKQDQLAAMCSDWETDDQKKEKKSPWPAAMQDDVWGERVKFRRLLKDNLPLYRSRNEESESFFAWLKRPEVNRAAIFEMPLEHIKDFIHSNFKHAYQVVLTSVLQQVTNFYETGYCNDGATLGEIAVEECLFAERGALLLEPDLYQLEEGQDVLFQRFVELGGAHLMEKRDEEIRQQAGEAADAVDEAKDSQSFRADRRLLRIVITRYYADMAWKKFKKSQHQQ